MKIFFFYTVLLFLSTNIWAQTKTMHPFGSAHKNAKALVIGISTYENIKGLSYADKDAIEFANFLQENRGWGLDAENIQLLTNENAKQGDILIGLQWLLDAAINQEDVIFYFSGHGDVEVVGEQKKGFLLANDSPKNNYPLGGTIEVQLLDSVFSELISRNSKVTIIVDACRSGNLAGGMSGKQQTSEALAQKWQNQVKILSAQPEQLSYEDEKWGGGRGVFSYYLVKGMSGFANSDNDQKIRLSELENYLGNNLSVQTSYTQQPIVEGPNKFTLAISYADSLQMKRYETDLIEGEVTLAMASKSNEYNLSPTCKKYSDKIEILLNSGLKMDSFVTLNSYWKKLDSCAMGSIPFQLKYNFMRSLINEINKVVNVTLTGQKMDIETEFIYGLELIETLEKINNNKNFIGKAHFEMVKDYMKSVHFGFYNDEYFETIKFEYEIAIEETLDYYDVDELQTLLSEYGYYDITILDFDTNHTPNQIVTIKSDLYQANDVIDLLGMLTPGKYRLQVTIFGDTIFISEKEYPKGKKEKSITIWNFDKNYRRFMLKKLENDCLLEPDAAYLYYSRAVLYSRNNEADSAILMLQKCIELSPKWLNPRYFLGAGYKSDKQYTKAIETFESIFELDTIYQDFECIDCFFKGLITLYLKENQIEKIDLTIDKWLKMRKDGKSILDINHQMFDFSENKKQRKFWLNRLRKLSPPTFEDQVSLLIQTRRTYKNKYSDKEVIKFVRILTQLKNKGSIKQFIEDENRNSYSNSILKEFFPIGKSFAYSDTTDFNQEIQYLLGYALDLHLFYRKDIVKELFMLDGIGRMNDLESYSIWTNELIYQKDKSKYNNTNEWIDWSYNQDLDNMPKAFARLFDLDVKGFEENYALSYDPEFFDFIFNLSSGLPFKETEEYKKIASKCKTFSDFEYLKKIEIKMQVFEEKY